MNFRCSRASASMQVSSLSGARLPQQAWLKHQCVWQSRFCCAAGRLWVRSAASPTVPQGYRLHVTGDHTVAWVGRLCSAPGQPCIACLEAAISLHVSQACSSPRGCKSQCRQQGRELWREPRAWQIYALPQRRQQQQRLRLQADQRELWSRLPLQMVGLVSMHSCGSDGHAQLWVWWACAAVGLVDVHGCQHA